tara:strand:- start:555 stop:1352 length:798 start_codon:yes stop_codon:yes gene_type:complete
MSSFNDVYHAIGPQLFRHDWKDEAISSIKVSSPRKGHGDGIHLFPGTDDISLDGYTCMSIYPLGLETLFQKNRPEAIQVVGTKRVPQSETDIENDEGRPSLHPHQHLFLGGFLEEQTLFAKHWVGVHRYEMFLDATGEEFLKVREAIAQFQPLQSMMEHLVFTYCKQHRTVDHFSYGSGIRSVPSFLGKTFHFPYSQFDFVDNDGEGIQLLLYELPSGHSKLLKALGSEVVHIRRLPEKKMLNTVPTVPDKKTVVDIKSMIVGSL